MRPYYDEDGITIYHADCRDVVAQLPDDAADVVLTDPPYNAVNRETWGLRALSKGSVDSLPFDPVWAAEQFARLASGSIYVWCSTEQVSALRQGLVDVGLSTRLGIWEKSNPSPMNGEHMWLSGVEACVYGRHPKAYFDRHCATRCGAAQSRNRVGTRRRSLSGCFRNLCRRHARPGGP